MVDVLVLVAAGLLITLLPLSRRYTSFLARRTARLAGGQLPPEQVPALRTRAARRASGTGLGMLTAGVIWFVVSQLWPERYEQPSGVYVVLSLLCVSSAAGLAVVEILRPGDVSDRPRFARTTSPALADYVAPQTRLVSRLFVGLSVVVLAGSLVLAQSQWFDAPTLWRSPVPFLLAAVPVLALLSALAIKRVLDAPQPARDQRELYWQDAIRAETLSTLTVPPAVVGLLALVVVGVTLDDAASATATATGEIGPDWTGWLLFGGYLLPVVTVIAAAVAIASAGGEMRQFNRRLWSTAAPATGAEAN